MATAKAEASLLLFARRWLSGGTQQIGVCTGILRGDPANLILGSRALASEASRWSSVRSPALPPLRESAGRDGFSSVGRRQEQEHLWHQFFLDPTMWWDNRRDKKSSRSPDFLRKGSGEELCLNNMFKPAWVDEKLISLDMQMGHGASVRSPALPHPKGHGASVRSPALPHPMGHGAKVRSPALPHPMVDGASPSESSSQDKPEPGRPEGSKMGVVTAVTVITLCQEGKLSEAVRALESLAHTGAPISQYLLYSVLKLCTAKKDLVAGRRVHDLIVKLGYESSAYLGNHILRMYAGGGRLEEALDVLTRVGKPDAFMWSSIISAHAKQGRPNEAIQLYHEMRRSGVKADAHVFVAALQSCAFASDLESGRKVHHDVMQSDIPTSVFVGNCLVDMYAKCGQLKDARQVFDSMATKDVVTWNALIAGYAQQGLGYEALALYEQMEQDGLIVADHVTFACLLQACASTGALQKGRQLHSLIVERGLLDNIILGTCLVDMYAKCGQLKRARQVFDSMATKGVVTWTALISGYAQQGRGQEALVLYGQMEQEGLIVANPVTFTCLLKACASTGASHKGRQLHSLIVERGLLDDVVLGTCLVDMYAKCGELEEARQVFDSMATKDVVTWTALISGYAQQGLGQEALVVYERMQQEGLIVSDHFTFACLLKACGSTGALQKGRQLHSQIVEKGLLDNVVLGNCLVDMYAKCGELEGARQAFDSMNTRDVLTWNALISGYGTCDEGRKALACFEEMLVAGIQPNEVTFTCLLVACSHGGLVHDGRKHFDSMAETYGIKPTLEHYNCMIDLLGRAGLLDEAEKMLLSCDGQSNVVGLTSLLNACKSHGDIERAMWCFERIVRLDPQEAPAYVLMANAYADAGRWTDVDRIETQRRLAGAYKKPAVATIEVNKQVHRFLVGERREDIALKVESTNARLKQEGGHVPHTKLVLKPLFEKEKEDALCGHAEKLALAFGLLNTPSGTPLVVTKNLRMCSDCHNSTEIMSRLERRDIVVRDGYRVHRFAAGCCSCKGRP